MSDSIDLRKILSKNIRTAREDLRITQVRLAEYAGISLPYLLDIEHCKTWVSDKTLTNIAKALNVEAYELLVNRELSNDKSAQTGGGEADRLQEIIALFEIKQKNLKQSTDDIMSDLLSRIIMLYKDR
ncbi:MAG: helix-turn-helix transcriptional regulator [Spirochaetaceae bacterium]|nr:helix-turn-helix transcriptional regulator [Spirochaetaceae bacterium]